MQTIRANNSCSGCGDCLECDSMAIVQEGMSIVVCDICTEALDTVFGEIGEPENLTDIVITTPDGEDRDCLVCGSSFFTSDGVVIKNGNHITMVCHDCGERVESLINVLTHMIETPKVAKKKKK